MLSIYDYCIYEGANQIDWKKWGKRAAIGAGVLGGISLAHKVFNQQPGGNGSVSPNMSGAAVITKSAGSGSVESTQQQGNTTTSNAATTIARPVQPQPQQQLHTYSEPPGRWSNETYVPQPAYKRVGGSLPPKEYASVHPQTSQGQNGFSGGGFVGPTNAQSRIVPMGAKPFAYDHSKTPFDNIHTREMSLPVSADQWRPA